MDDAQHQDFKAYEQVAPKIFPRGQLLRAWPLTGGVSATITALEILKPGYGVTKVIIRRHGDADLERNSHVAADEFRLLQALNSAGLAVPAPYCFDESGEILPTPYVVVEYVEGKTEIESPDPSGVAARMAAQLAAIHAVKGIVPDLSFLPGQRQRLAAWFEECPANPSPPFDERRIRETLKQVWPLPRVGQSALLHGDFWPGNILWKDGEVAAVIDWEDAEIGDPLGDLANSRLEVLWAFGPEAMQQYTRHYQSLTSADCSRLPYWDLVAALQAAPKIPKWCLDEPAEAGVRGKLQLFITTALGEIEALRPGS